MTPAHAGHHPGLDSEVVVLAAILAVAAGYLLLAVRRRREARGWSGWRIAAFCTGCLLLVLAVAPEPVIGPAADLPWHMQQHLLIGMYAPLGLVLGAPVTLLLRTLQPRRGRALVRVLRARPLRLLAHPVTALLLTLGGLALLYFTPLYAATTDSPLLHGLVHLHFLAAGCLFAWVIAGPDPAPHRPSVPARLVILGVAIAGHAVLAQLMYAGIGVRIAAPPAELRAAGDLMYYGGDIAELLLALALVTTWHPRRSPDPVRGAGARSGWMIIGPR